MLASSSASMLHFRAMLGHLGDKMANKMGKMAARSAKMNQDGPTWDAEAIEGLPGSAPTGPGSGLRRPLEELFRKEKTKESGRICKRLCKGFDEVVQHAGSPFGDGGFNRFAQSAGPG